MDEVVNVDNFGDSIQKNPPENETSDEKSVPASKTEKTEDLNVEEKEQTEEGSQTDEAAVELEIEPEPEQETVAEPDLETAKPDCTLPQCGSIITEAENALSKKETRDSEDEEMEDNASSNNNDPRQRILWASEKNEIDAVRLLLDEDPTLVSALDEDLYTPLHRASSNNHVEIVKLLLEAGAELNARTDDGWYPLHCACRWDSVEAASLLLQGGADVNTTSKGGLTPLHLAAANGSGRRTLELLLWHPHIDGTLRAENGDTAHDVACRTSNSLLRLFELLEESVNCF